MSDEIERIASDIERKLAERSKRTMLVLREFLFYEEETQTFLTQTIVSWVFCSVAEHANRRACKAAFDSYVDLMYANSDSAQKEFTADGCAKLATDAHTRWLGLYGTASKAAIESFSELMKLPDGHDFKEAAKLINLATGFYWDHLQVHDRGEVASRCTAICFACGFESWSWRDESPEDVRRALVAITDAAEYSRRAIVPVMQAINSGELRIEDGVIINPKRMDDWEDDWEDDEVS